MQEVRHDVTQRVVPLVAGESGTIGESGWEAAKEDSQGAVL